MPINEDGTWTPGTVPGPEDEEGNPTTVPYTQDRFTADAVRAEADAEGTLEATRAAQAEAGKVQDARFIGYAEVLDVYNKRSDTEPLADRRARHLAANPAEQDFTREANYTGNAVDAQTRRTDGNGEWTSEYTDAPDARPQP